MKRKNIIVAIGFLAVVGLLILKEAPISLAQSKQEPPPKIPYYFFAIHNEPRVDDLEINYQTLKDLIDKANKYNMKLTLMFAPQWADFIVKDPTRSAELATWKSQGHEIAGHHHSVRHPGVWDGYSNLPKEEALAIRKGMGKDEAYLGNLNDYISELKKLNPDICSGCMNDEGDKSELPDAIIFDTCSGYANFGEPGTKLADPEADKGKNEFISVGTVNGVERKWLTHTTIFDAAKEKETEPVFDSMQSGAFGAVTHSVSFQAAELMKFMDFIHAKDPGGAKSKTLSEIIKSKLLPEKHVDLSMKSNPPAAAKSKAQKSS